ncbi:AMP-binding protein [Sporosarcina gallistercoris]|uniref:AMP-binding protein n=1 Tax=Sporosarcina gallistercoris TaxID=2762245 RepID=A0ABR8PIZ7_9BACL|nr:AMP-binding protein [Sporosarcina gallistercoris]MBD7908128.1 AMP-binding protein [Sporosarcina gallistercoris]
MQVRNLTHLLKEMKLLSPMGAVGFASSVAKHGVNIMTLLELAEKFHGDKIAIVDDQESISYSQLCKQCDILAFHLQQTYAIDKTKKVAFLCQNQSSVVKAIFSVARLGADIYLLNTEMGSSHFDELLKHHAFDLLIYDQVVSGLVDNSVYRNPKILSFHDDLHAINHMTCSESFVASKVKRTSAGKIVLLTSGTTGKPKKVIHQPSLFNYVQPFLTMVTKLKLTERKNVMIATPVYHGYGIAILLSFLALGKTVILSKGFSAEKVCTLIRTHEIEVITVVPLMIEKLLTQCDGGLTSLKCIASGGATLHPKLVQCIEEKLGQVLFNLYGTSESGLNCIATPEELSISRCTIGRVIQGSRLKILDEKKKEVVVGKIGQFYVKNKWSMKNKESRWISTGDLGYKDQHGLWYLCGRTDDMIVSAGENVYPIELEQLIRIHPLVKDVAVIGIEDDRFGQRLCAFIEPVNDELTSESFNNWLTGRAARYQMPKKVIILSSIPYTSLGKTDKKRLRAMTTGCVSL